jgi:Tfp pilus assembly protein PilX
MKNSRSPRGYIAVVSALMLCSILTLLVLTESISAFWSRFQELYAERKSQSVALAESCAYEALAEYEEDPNSAEAVLNQTIFSNAENQTSDDSCIIDSISFNPNSGIVLIRTHAEVLSTYSSLYVTATVATSSGIVSITSWRENTSIPP